MNYNALSMVQSFSFKIWRLTAVFLTIEKAQSYSVVVIVVKSIKYLSQLVFPLPTRLGLVDICFSNLCSLNSFLEEQ